MIRLLGQAALVLVLALAACTPSAPTAAPAPGATSAPAEQRDDRQTLNVAARSITANMTPAAAGGHWIKWQLYDTITKVGPKFAIEPQVATKWELSADGLTWRFTIRPDLTFSNG